VTVEEHEVAEFIDACTVLNAALKQTGGVWGVA